MGFLAKEIILGLTVQEFLLHLLNFLILLIALRLLLYKPVKKFMEKREREYKEAEDTYQESLRAIDESKAESQRLIDEAKQESVQIAEEAHALALMQTEEMLENAKSESEELMENAQKEAAEKRKQEKEALLYAISDLAVDLSERILTRELTSKDNDVYIESILKKLDGEDA